MKTGISYDPRFLDHDTGPGHPERRERLTATMDYLRGRPWFGGIAQFAPRPAEPDWVHTVHDPAYVARAAETCRSGAPYLDTMDVAVSEQSFDVALLAAGAPLVLADEVVAGRLDNALALIRPPGHHAERRMALGFCLFNNVAILARYLQKRHGIDKVLILDWDVHHGNGTQHTFEEDPSVMYVSTHQYPFYPGTGAHYETGIGRGEGATLNCPMPAGSTDDDYERAFIETILPAINRFRPEFVLVSAGFDAHRDDPLAHIALSTGFYGWMTERLLEVADQHAGGRLVSLLEGGYNLRRLPECVAEHLSMMHRGLSDLPAETPAR
jgi:acetoin utilization deacetylase AcuC-like enzyme